MNWPRTLAPLLLKLGGEPTGRPDRRFLERSVSSLLQPREWHTSLGARRWPFLVPTLFLQKVSPGRSAVTPTGTVTDVLLDPRVFHRHLLSFQNRNKQTSLQAWEGNYVGKKFLNFIKMGRRKRKITWT